jgi:hypothetical protein
VCFAGGEESSCLGGGVRSTREEKGSGRGTWALDKEGAIFELLIGVEGPATTREAKLSSGPSGTTPVMASLLLGTTLKPLRGEEGAWAADEKVSSAGRETASRLASRARE